MIRNKYPSKEAALQAARHYQEIHGGTLVEDGKAEDIDDDNKGRIIGVFEFVAVTFGATEENPLGERCEIFPYNYETL